MDIEIIGTPKKVTTVELVPSAIYHDPKMDRYYMLIKYVKDSAVYYLFVHVGQDNMTDGIVQKEHTPHSAHELVQSMIMMENAKISFKYPK
jgi:hypothetical protein